MTSKQHASGWPPGREAAFVAVLATLLLSAAGTDARVIDGGVGAPDLAVTPGLRAVLCCGKPCCPLPTDPGYATWTKNAGGWWDESEGSHRERQRLRCALDPARPQPRSDARIVPVLAVKARASFSPLSAPQNRQGAPN